MRVAVCQFICLFEIIKVDGPQNALLNVYVSYGSESESVHVHLFFFGLSFLPIIYFFFLHITCIYVQRMVQINTNIHPQTHTHIHSLTNKRAENGVLPPDMELYGTPHSHSANLPPYESFNYFQDDIYGSHVGSHLTSASRGEKQYEEYAKDYTVSCLHQRWLHQLFA